MRHFLIRWLIYVLSLALAARLVDGVDFPGDPPGVAQVLAVAAIFGVLNAVVKPLLIMLTLPLTLLTFGLFILVINALMLLLVSKLVKGFRLSGFWTAFFASLFISILSIAIGALAGGSPGMTIQMPQSGGWV